VKGILAAALAGLILGGCGNVLAPPAAIVGGRKVSTKVVTTALDRFEASSQFVQAAQQSGGSVVARQFEQSYLARLIRRYVLTGRARQLGITVTPAEVQHAIAQIESSFPTKAAFRSALQQQGLTLATLRPLVSDRVLEQKLRSRVTAHVASKAAKDRAWLQWLIAAYKAAKVNVDPRYGTLDLNTQTIVNTEGSFPGAGSPPPSPSPSGS
jgi:parvulin-like peptidyl-prolyl isomerase